MLHAIAGIFRSFFPPLKNSKSVDTEEKILLYGEFLIAYLIPFHFFHKFTVVSTEELCVLHYKLVTAIKYMK